MVGSGRKRVLLNSPKRFVRVENDDGRLRLRFSYGGKRYAMAVGLPDTPVNRQAAERTATQIELDIASCNFDPTLKKYKVQKAAVYRITAVDLFGQFIDYKAKAVYQRSLEKYQATQKQLWDFFEDRPASSISVNDAEKFTKRLSRKLAPITLKERLTLLNACWQWGFKQSLVVDNPWSEAMGWIKVPPKQRPKPFTREEITAIIQAFRSDRYYSYYADFVQFLFATGCRTGEAIALQWGHLSDDCSLVWIGESFSRGVFKPTKTNRARTFALTSSLQVMLLARRPANFNPKGLVFSSRNGKPIDDHNFRNRAWKTVLTKLEIVYRKPYTSRHSLVSHALHAGMSPLLVAQLTGHDVRTLYDDYAGVVSSRPCLPEL